MIHRSCFNYYEIRQTHPSKTKIEVLLKGTRSLKKPKGKQSDPNSFHPFELLVISSVTYLNLKTKRNEHLSSCVHGSNSKAKQII